MRKRMVVAFGVAALLFAVPALAANLEFKGIRLGMPMTDLKTMFPTMSCEEQGADVSICSEEHGDGDSQESYIFNLYQGKLARANIWFSTNKYRETKDALLRQLGKPTSKTDNEIEKKKVEVLTWMRPSSMLVVEQAVAADPKRTNVMLNDDMLMAQMGKATK
jgi:hypothetical protein